MIVDVYRNLKTGGFSIRHRGKVVGHRDTICMQNVRFVVQSAGQDRVRRERKKYVHAFVRGVIVEDDHSWRPTGRAYYNPYKNDTFVDDQGDPIKTHALVRLKGKCVELL